MTWLADMYVTLVPGIVAGILNMVWCTLPVARWLARPIDGGRMWRDGRRVFGDNKTWKGLVGMAVLGMAAAVVWGLVCAWVPVLSAHNLFYRAYANTIGYNAIIGLAVGVAYGLFELPNSFWKRRRDITPGKRTGGWGFVVLDQIDSAVGMVLVVACVYPMTVWFFVAYIAIGGVTHAVLNLLLFAARLRRNPL